MNIPTATYRIQFRDGMTFDRASSIVPYLKKLGISHLYASPIFTATSGSTHGYDVTDANEIDPAIGGRDGFERLARTLKEADLGLILDIVPNHMAASLENQWWKDVIENGADSAYASHFDIDWSRPLTLPVLGQDFDDALASGEISIERDPASGKPALRYFENFFPLKPASYAGRETKLMETSDKNTISGLHAEQHYRLMCWRDARRNLSYRRFFEVTGLVGIRVEDQRVFDDTHRLILELVRNGSVDGLRVDHVDGLADPKAYLDRLRREVGPDCYITVEKILGEDEMLASDWPVSGTTGYEFIAALSDLFVDDEKLPRLRTAYEEVEGRAIDMHEELRKAKLLMADRNFEGEFSRLLTLATNILKAEPEAGQFHEAKIRTALRELVVSFPIYRTYGTRDGLPHDSAAVLTKVIGAIERSATAPDAASLAGLQGILRGEIASASREKADEFRTRFQQLTGPLIAKSVEDTLFYRQNAALALNEVGAEPLPRPYSLQRFHDEMAKRLRSQPDGISTTSTHDTKRGEDARARLYALTEDPHLWHQAFKRWQGLNASFRHPLEDGIAPEASVEWMLYQALLGVWPHGLAINDRVGLEALEKRFIPYVEKAIREAKLRTNWGDGNEVYEKAVLDFAGKLVSPDNTAFLVDFFETIQPFIKAGFSNSLSQTLIKLTAPGVPDIYQGCEGLDLSLVDPDNRRMPDFDAFDDQLSAMKAPGHFDPSFKQRIIVSALHLRKESPELFREGSYQPLIAQGAGKNHVVSFARHTANDVVIVIAPRLAMVSSRSGTSPFHDTHIDLPPEFAHRQYVDLLSRRQLDCKDTIAVTDIEGPSGLALLRSR